MKILLLGSGGREHAMAWAIAQNPKCDELICAPGNAGIAAVAQCVDLDIMDGAAVRAFVEAERIDFTVVGPEAPLVAGIADVLRDAGHLVLGPGAAAAQLEASKAFTKDVCDAAGAPTAAYAHFKDLREASEYVRTQGAPIVIKADGLAAGKGVTVAMDVETALAALDDMFGGSHGEAGAEVVIEEFMEGEEASLFYLCNGLSHISLGTAQDHKRAFDGDKGPNTGGMGAYSPAPVLTDAIQQQALDRIVMPTLQEMERRGTPFQGILYVGLMIRDGEARLVEYNVRLGDPEAQVLMMRLGAQALDAFLACAENRLEGTRLQWADDHALTVVMAAEGYPGSYAKGTEIRRLEEAEGDPLLKVFHAGTKADADRVLANGGRVLNVSGRGATLSEARDRAYAAVAKIDWPEGFCRSDIGWRAL